MEKCTSNLGQHSNDRAPRFGLTILLPDFVEEHGASATDEQNTAGDLRPICWPATRRDGWPINFAELPSCSKIGKLADWGVAFLNVPLVTC